MASSSRRRRRGKLKNRVFFIGVFSVLAVIFVACAAVFISQMAEVNKVESQYVAYQEELQEIEDENAVLQDTIESEDFDDYMEEKARENGYVKSDEIVFYDIAGSN